MQMTANIGQLAAALAKAQGAIEGASKDKSNTFFKSKYADLGSVWDACREALSVNGLSVVQLPELTDAGVTLTTILLHASGESLSAALSAPLKETTPQAIGSLITYLRRYSLMAIAGVAPEDDDAEGAMGRRAQNGNGSHAQPSADPAPSKPLAIWQQAVALAKEHAFDCGKDNALLWAWAAKVTSATPAKWTEEDLNKLEAALNERAEARS